MKDRSFPATYARNMFANWGDLTRTQKPVRRRAPPAHAPAHRGVDACFSPTRR